VEDNEELLSKLKFEYLKISNSVGGELSGDNK